MKVLNSCDTYLPNIPCTPCREFHLRRKLITKGSSRFCANVTLIHVAQVSIAQKFKSVNKLSCCIKLIM
jgi:hypothetical protein